LEGGGHLERSRASAAPIGVARKIAGVSAPTIRLPITALVGSHNEADLLPRCLSSLRFCDEILVIDIDSTDDTVEVAAAFGARVIRHPLVEIAEVARVRLAAEAEHEWLLFLDPDEVLPSALAEQIAVLMQSLDPDVGAIDCPWQFLFRHVPLRGTIWGGISRKRTLARRGGVDLHPTVHSGTTLRPGFRAEQISYTGDNAIAHHWAQDYRSLIAKHRRYLKLEGPDRYSNGLITGYKEIARTPLWSFIESFITRRGFRDGPTGLALSLLWATYSTGAKVALLRELRRRGAASTGLRRRVPSGGDD
jgi:glycosyltransferase involved in cell wall biosynthesis